MDFSCTTPCRCCPFRRDPGAVRLTPGRVREVAGNMLNWSGGEMPCHLTMKRPSREQVHCAGALIFATKNDITNQIQRIAERLGLYDQAQFATSPARDEIFDNLADMLKGHARAGARLPRKRTPP